MTPNFLESLLYRHLEGIVEHWDGLHLKKKSNITGGLSNFIIYSCLQVYVAGNINSSLKIRVQDSIWELETPKLCVFFSAQP